MNVVLGHQGGWDEILIGLGVIGVVYVVSLGIWTLRKREQPTGGASPSDHRSRLEERRRINEESRREKGSDSP